MHKLYFLEPAVRFDDQLVHADAMETETTLCPLNAGLPSQHTMKQRWSSPIKAVGPVRPMTDFEWTVYNDILVNRETAETFRSAGFSGMEFRPAEIFTTTQTPIGREVYELKVTGWGGIACPESGVHVVEECPRCKRQVFSGSTNPQKLFSLEAWDGSDFFIIWPMPRYTFITGRVADLISKFKFSGVRVNPLDQFPQSISGGYTPGHLHDWFDDKRLAEIIAQLDE